MKGTDASLSSGKEMIHLLTRRRDAKIYLDLFVIPNFFVCGQSESIYYYVRGVLPARHRSIFRLAAKQMTRVLGHVYSSILHK